jgi:hypothetical protein
VLKGTDDFAVVVELKYVVDRWEKDYNHQQQQVLKIEMKVGAEYENLRAYTNNGSYYERAGRKFKRGRQAR